MISIITTVLLALPLTLSSPISPRSTGDLTYYAPGLGACGGTNTENDLIVAVSAGRFDASDLCNKQIRVSGPAGSVDVTVVDRCAGCANDDLDLSPAAFKQAAGDLTLGRVQGDWDFI